MSEHDRQSRARLAGRRGHAHLIAVRPDDATTDVNAGPEAALDCAIDLAEVPRGEVGACLAWLRRLARPVALTMSVAPRAQRAATLLPADTWHALLAVNGFEVLEELRDTSAQAEGAWAAAWRSVDPWRTGDLVAIHVLVAPVAVPVDDQAVARRTRILAGPQHARVGAGRRIGFLVSGFQDFHTVASWVARMRAADAVILLRDATFGTGADLTPALREASAGLGPPIVTLGADLAQDLYGTGIEVLVSASESPANLVHQGNAATLLVARQLGIATAHAQHGIWPRAEFPPPIVSVADAVLAWSPEYVEVMRSDGVSHVVGAPRFDRYADGVGRSREALYGGWTAKFARHVILATNLHWGEHRQPLDVRSLVQRLAEREPTTLFTWKPHPYEPSPSPEGLPSNVVLVPETMMLAAGLEFADLVEAADAVVTTPSTVALEAALAGVPCLVVSTGNPNHHRFQHEVPLERLDRWLDAPAPDGEAEAYANHYCAPSTRGQAFGLAIEALRPLQPRPLPRGVALTVCGLYGAVSSLGRQSAAQQASMAEASRYVQSLTRAIEHKNAYISSLLARRSDT